MKGKVRLSFRYIFMSNAKRLMQNTMLLTVTNFIMKTVSMVFSVYLTNKIGADGIGLFQLISAVYAMAVTFASGGVRLASMRLVADDIALGKKSERQIIGQCTVYSLLCGILIAAAMCIFADLIGSKWIGDMRSIPSLKILAISLPFVSVSSALNGYFTAVGKLFKYTVVQLAEQIFKIAVTVFTLGAVLSHGLEASCVAITTGITLSEIFSLLCSYTLYLFSSEKSAKSDTSRSVIKRLLRISLPDAIGSEMRSILMTIEHLLIPVGFRKSGSDPQAALATYGIIHGIALQIVLYPSALLSSLSGLLVPEISSHYISGRTSRITYIISRVIHLAMIFSIGTAGIMYANANELSQAVYGSADAGFYMRVFAPLIPVMYMDMTVDGMLKGLDQQVSYMRYNIIDASLCVILVYFLVPIFSVQGYIMVVFISELVNFVLSFRRLTVVSEVRVSLFKDMLIPLLCIISSNLIKNLLFTLCNISLSIKAYVTVSILLSIAVYAVLLIVFGSVDREELQWLTQFFKINANKTKKLSNRSIANF